MRQAFEKAAQVYEGVKKSVQEKWDGFKKKFEGTKSEMSQEVMSAKSPDDLIALGKKLQEQGEALKVEEQGVKQEEAGEGEKYEVGKKEMMDADYEEGHEMNKAFDENKAAEEAAKEKIRIAEEDKLKAENEAAQLAEIRAKINGGGVEATAEPVNLEKAEPNAIKEKEVSEDSQIDAVALNNKIVNMPHHKQQEAIDNLTQEEIKAVAKNIAKGDFEHTLDFLNNFKNKPEIIAQPEIIDKFKKVLAGGNVHLYNVDRILGLPGTEEVFKDAEVQKGVKNSIRSFVSYQNSSEWPHVSGAIDRVVKGANIDNKGLRDIAEEIKGNSDTFQLFVRHFGVKSLYPEA